MELTEYEREIIEKEISLNPDMIDGANMDDLEKQQIEKTGLRNLKGRRNKYNDRLWFGTEDLI